MATGPNTRSDQTVRFTIKTASPGDCIPPKMANELLRRLGGSLPPPGNTGDAVVSRTPPEDKSKIWYVADENGVPTGEVFAYNTKTGNWESTAQSIPPIPCLSTNIENIMTTDAVGCWIVTEQKVKEVAQSVTVTISTDTGNILKLGTDLGLYLSTLEIPLSPNLPNFLTRDLEENFTVPASVDAGNAVMAGDDDKLFVPRPKILAAPITLVSGAIAAGSSDVSLFTAIPTWATHVIVAQPNNISHLPLSANFVNHPALLAGEVFVLVGFIQGQP